MMKTDEAERVYFPHQFRRLSITNVVFSFKRPARRKKGAVIAIAVLCCAVLCECSPVPHGSQAPFAYYFYYPIIISKKQDLVSGMETINF